MRREKVLVVVAHPDDEILGVGGTIIKMRKYNKWDVKIVVLADGISWREKDEEKIKRQKQAANKAADLMGCDIVVGDFKDQLLDTYPIGEIADFVYKQLIHFNPDTVITHHWGDINQDHTITFQAVNIAIRPLGKKLNIKKFMSMYIPSSSNWSFKPMDIFFPNLFIDISESINNKIEVFLEAYKHETKVFPHPRSKEGILFTARYFGSISGLEYAEPFNILWSRDLL